MKKFNNVLYFIIMLIVACVIFFVFLNSSSFGYSSFTLFNVIYIIFFFIIVATIIYNFVKNVNATNKTDKKTDRYFEDKLDEVNKNNNYNDPLDKEMDHLSEELKDKHLANEGIITDKYSDFNKVGDLTLYLTIKDLTNLDSFNQKVSEKEFNDHYVGQHVLIVKSGFKRKYKDL